MEPSRGRITFLRSCQLEDVFVVVSYLITALAGYNIHIWKAFSPRIFETLFCFPLASNTAVVIASVILSLSAISAWFSLILWELFEIWTWCEACYSWWAAFHMNIHCEGPVSSLLESVLFVYLFLIISFPAFLFLVLSFVRCLVWVFFPIHFFSYYPFSLFVLSFSPPLTYLLNFLFLKISNSQQLSCHFSFYSFLSSLFHGYNIFSYIS